MTTGSLEPFYPLDASPEGTQRTLDLARRALRARDAVIVCAGDYDPSPQDELVAELSADIVPEASVVARLVVRDAEGREWSPDDRAMLGDLAASFAAEIRLRGERERQRAVFDKLPGLVYECNKTGPAEARYSVLGASKTVLPAVRELIEGSATGAPLDFIHRDDREAVRSAMLRSIVEDSDLDVLFRVKDFDSRLRWVRSHSVARHETDGSVAWSGFCFDVTDLVTRLSAANLDLPNAAPMVADVDAIATPRFAAKTIEAEGADDASGLRILLADDLDLNRKLISDMLSLDGYVVDSVADGAAAVEAAKAKPYALILMDMIMPGMDGMDATRAIRALPSPACDVPIVALTAHSFREQLDNCLHAGMNATLTKPMSFDALIDAVGTWARGRHQAA